MAVIWGLDLREIQWGKFKHANMFDKQYHLRSTKMIVYQLAMIFMVVSESVGTASLSDYVDQQDGISTRFGGLVTQNNDIVGVFSFNIFVGIAVATIFGSGFFFDLFWPERKETKRVRMAWKGSAIGVAIFALADLVAITVIVATRRATIRGLTNEQAEPIFQANGPPNPIYRHYAMNVASVVIGWLGVVFSFAAAYVMYISINHDEKFGPKSSKFRTKSENHETQSTANEMTTKGEPRIAGPYPGT